MFASSTKLIKVVVVVFPSDPVMPITLAGVNLITCSTSVVTMAPLSFSLTISSLVGKHPGDLKIISKFTNLLRPSSYIG